MPNSGKASGRVDNHQRLGVGDGSTAVGKPRASRITSCQTEMSSQNLRAISIRTSGNQRGEVTQPVAASASTASASRHSMHAVREVAEELAAPAPNFTLSCPAQGLRNRKRMGTDNVLAQLPIVAKHAQDDAAKLSHMATARVLLHSCDDCLNTTKAGADSSTPNSVTHARQCTNCLLLKFRVTPEPHHRGDSHRNAAGPHSDGLVGVVPEDNIPNGTNSEPMQLTIQRQVPHGLAQQPNATAKGNLGDSIIPLGVPHSGAR